MCTLRKQKGIREIKAEHRGATSEVVITARSLFLNRYLTVSKSGEKLGVDYLDNWKSDTYVGALGLTPSLLNNWGGRTVIDVGCGLSLFSLEADLLRIHVHRFDRNVNGEMISEGQKAIEKMYAENLELFSNAYKNKNGFEPIFRKVWDARERTINNYTSALEKTKIGDATHMTDIPADTYDVALTVYMLAYLEDLQQESVIREMVRIVKPGGQIRLFPGSSPNKISLENFREFFERDRRYSFKRYRVKSDYCKYSHGQFVINDKVVTVDYQESGHGLIVLNIAAYDPYYFHTVLYSYCDSKKGKQCIICRATHGFLPSVFNSWHECRECGRVFCPRCGASLPKTSCFSRERMCDCGGRTALI
jgi:SAM-dependent methyltransferase